MPESGWGHLDLFSGPGGFATGFEWAGFRSLLGVDIHGPSLATYKRNHPSAAVILADIREVSSDRIEDAIAGATVHVITAGVPCEGFSMSNRNRSRFLDERAFLFLEFLRIAEHFRPPYLVLENVGGLATHSSGFYRQEIEQGMRDLGYIVESKILNALDYGVPQRRKRIFFVGVLPGYHFGWPEPTHGAGRKPHVTVGEALGDLPSLRSGEAVGQYDMSIAISEYAAFLKGQSRALLNHEAPKHPPQTIEKIAATEPGKPLYPKFRQRIRLHPGLPSPTIVSGGIRPQFSYGHPTQARGMSIRERARLQSFPDSYFFEGGIVQGRVQTGDAVPPLLARALAAEIVVGLRSGANGHTPFEVSQPLLLQLALLEEAASAVPAQATSTARNPGDGTTSVKSGRPRRPRARR